MKPSLSIAFLLLATTFIDSAENPTVNAVTKQDKSLTLSWHGGKAPFQVHQSQDLITWNAVGTTDEALFTINEATEASSYYRVQGSEDLGNYVGQWRIAEGEFGHALAKHRLKSIWSFYHPDGARFTNAKSFFTEATIRLHYLEGDEMATFTGKLADLPEANLTFKDSRIDVAWEWGQGASARTMTLEMEFSYMIEAVRFTPINLSDPRMTLTANYTLPKPNVDAGGKLTTVKSEEATLVEVDDEGDRPNWWNRSMQFTEGGVSIDSTFGIGVPLIEGGPAFIFKTPLLVSWDATTITGLTSEPIVLTGRFSQTYYPFHHNFIETLWLEPALEPGIDPAILAELKENNIRFIIPQHAPAFPGEEPTLRVMGFDQSIRSL